MRARLFALCVALASWWCGVSGSCSRLRARANGRPRLAKHRHITRADLGTTVPYPRYRNDIRQPMVHLVCAPSVSYRYRYRYWYRNVPPNSKLNQRSHPAGFQLSVDDLTHLGEDPEQAAGRRGEVGAARAPARISYYSRVARGAFTAFAAGRPVPMPRCSTDLGPTNALTNPPNSRHRAREGPAAAAAMRASAAAALVACGLVGSVRSYSGPAEQENYDDANVVTLSPTDFSDASSAHLLPMLVDFYAYGPQSICAAWGLNKHC